MNQWVPVNGIADGTDVSAASVNPSIRSLTLRTAYLYERVNELSAAGGYDAIRIRDVPVGATALVAGDVVALDNGYAIPALAVFGEDGLAPSAIVMGVIESVSIDGATCVVVASGRIEVGGGTGIPARLNDGEELRAGPYWVSSTEQGRITARPTGPRIYVGFYTTLFAVLAPDHGVSVDRHTHTSVPMFARPAGQQVVTGDSPTDTHAVIGYAPDAVLVGTRAPRLVVVGNVLAPGATQYILTLHGVGGVTIPPGAFPDAAFITWTSNDVNEANGSVLVRGFEFPVVIGTKGMVVYLENPTGLYPEDGDNWGVPYTAAAGTDTQAHRTWTVKFPEAGQGWVAARTQTTMERPRSRHLDFQLVGNLTTDDGRTTDTITVIPPRKIHVFTDIALPVTGDTTTVGTKVYEYYDIIDTVASGHIGVLIAGDAADPIPTYRNLMAAILLQDDGSVPVLSERLMTLAIGVSDNRTVTHAEDAHKSVIGGAGTMGIGSTATPHSSAEHVHVLIFDINGNSLIAGNSIYAGPVVYWAPITLSNGLIAIPSHAPNSPLPAVLFTDLWTTNVHTTAPGYAFQYAAGLHPAFAAKWPPKPIDSGSLLLNGVELPLSPVAADAPTCLASPDTVYWRDDTYGRVPWPADWESVTVVGSPHLQQNMLYRSASLAGGGNGIVTSLRPAAGAPIKVRACGTGAEATSGDLELELELSLSTANANIAGYNVVKGVKGNQLITGPVVERLYPGPGISLTQEVGAPAGQGKVSIGLTAGSELYEGSFDDIALENAKQSIVGMFTYIRLLGNTTTPTGFTAKFRVPHTLPAESKYRVIVYATMFGDKGVNYAVEGLEQQYSGLEFSYSILPDVTAIGGVDTNSNLLSGTIQMKKPAWIQVPIGDPASAYTAYDPMLLHNNPAMAPDVVGARYQVLGDPFPSAAQLIDTTWAANIGGTDDDIAVRPGSLVGIRISKARIYANSGAEEYKGDLGFINLRWALVTVQ